MAKEHELTDIQKGEILGLIPHFLERKIGRQLGIPHETVNDFIHRYQTHQSTENLLRPGRLSKLSKRTDRLLVRLVESKTRIPFQELKNELNQDVSKRTIQRHLQKVAGIRKW